MKTVSVQLCTESDFTQRRDLTQKTHRSGPIVAIGADGRRRASHQHECVPAHSPNLDPHWFQGRAPGAKGTRSVTYFGYNESGSFERVFLAFVDTR
jgi:hypothetical protein